MSDPLRTEHPSGREVSHPADPAVQIERLLLSGLDLYFSGQYQDAINTWTRVVFLERGHSRARAYIERARTAIAEQQRESDELFYRGRTAYDGGDLHQARQLLTRAIERGGSSDDALLLLQQINRFSPAAHAHDEMLLVPGTTSAVDAAVGEAGRGRVQIAAVVALVSALALFAAPIVSWFGDSPTDGDRGNVTTGPVEALPVVRTGDVAVENARQLYAGGHLADALRALERIDIGDPRRLEAERLKGDIQRDLLATVRQSQPIQSNGATR